MMTEKKLSQFKEKPAIVLLSGGLDSTTVLALATNKNFKVYAMSIDYGQKNRFELERAAVIAKKYEVAEHRTMHIDLRAFGGSSLTSDIAVEKNRTMEQIAKGVPMTYVPARNTIFLSYALGWSEVVGAADIFIGVNIMDNSGYPDCRIEFIEAFSKLANLATKNATEYNQKINIHAPLQFMTKAEIINLGITLGVDYSLTNTCYDPSTVGQACGRCDACILRKKGFEELGLEDPIAYIK